MIVTPTTREQKVEFDHALADLHAELSKLGNTLELVKNRIHSYAGDTRERFYSTARRSEGPWKMTFTEAQAVVEARFELDPKDGGFWSYEVTGARKVLDEYGEIFDKMAQVGSKIRQFNEVYAANRWSRFFLVDNTNGHIHSSMACSTCFPTTQFGWLPDLSGLTEKDAVDAHGTILCSVCFPSAPVEWTRGKQDDRCQGTRDYDAPSRTGFYGGNWATCTCGERVALTSTGKLRKHKPKVSA